MNERDLATRDAREERRTVREHTRKVAKARASNSDESKVATSATREPDHNDRTKYASALAGVLRRWFGDEGLSVARELVRILEGSQ